MFGWLFSALSKSARASAENKWGVRTSSSLATNNVTFVSCGLFPTNIHVGGTASSVNSHRMKLRMS